MKVSLARLETGMLIAAVIVSLILICSSLTAFGRDSTLINQMKLESTPSEPYSPQISKAQQKRLQPSLSGTSHEPPAPQKTQQQRTTMSPSVTQHQPPPTLHSRAKPAHMSASKTLHYQKRCWHTNHSLPDKTPLDHSPLPFLVGESETSGPSCRGEILLLIMVHSAVPNRDRRELIRRTWASVSNIGGDRLATVFFVGRSESPNENSFLRAESDSRADIVQGDFVDTYRNLTYKHLYALRWIGERCQSVRFVMKVDDDVVLNVFQLRVVLRERLASTKGDFFYCQINRIKPIRKSGSKWRVTTEEWAADVYPDYCKGFGYVMTGSLIVPLHHCAKWRRYFWIDDVFVSGALASALGARRIQWEDGWNARDMHPRLAGPEAGQLVLVVAASNWVSPSLHTMVWRAMVKHSGELGFS